MSDEGFQNDLIHESDEDVELEVAVVMFTESEGEGVYEIAGSQGRGNL